jgi:hypothetical protein
VKCILKGKESIQSLVEPIESSSKIFNALKLPTSFIQEFDDDGIYVGNSDEDNTVLVSYRINVESVFNDYEVIKDKVGIWDTNQFTKIFKKYLKLYDSDKDIQIDFQDNKYIISSGSEEDIFHTASPKQIRQGSRGIDTSKLTEVCSFDLEGTDLLRILSNIDVYTEQNTVSFVGNAEDGKILVKVHSPDVPNQNSGSSTVDDAEVSSDFSIDIGKIKIKSVLETNDKFTLRLYALRGKPMVLHFYYDKGGYDMNYYISPNNPKKK